MCEGCGKSTCRYEVCNTEWIGRMIRSGKMESQDCTGQHCLATVWPVRQGQKQ